MRSRPHSQEESAPQMLLGEFTARDGGSYSLMRGLGSEQDDEGTDAPLYIQHDPGDRRRRRAALIGAGMFALLGYSLSTGYFYWENATTPATGGDGLSQGWGYFCFAPCFFAPVSSLSGYLLGWFGQRRANATRFRIDEALTVNGKVLGDLTRVEADVVGAAVVLRAGQQHVRLEALTERDAVEMADLIERER